MTSDAHSDALVFFGATGDLAYKKIFPALQAMVKRGHLAVPAHVLAAALFARFASRGEADFQDRLLSAMRFEFGGHLEKRPGA